MTTVVHRMPQGRLECVTQCMFSEVELKVMSESIDASHGQRSRVSWSGRQRRRGLKETKKLNNQACLSNMSTGSHLEKGPEDMTRSGRSQVGGGL